LKSAVSGALGAIGSHPQPGAGEFGRALGGAGAAPMRYNAVPPAQGGGGAGMRTAAVYLGREKVGRIVLASIAEQASGPIQGMVHADATRRMTRNDTSYIA